MDADLDDQSPVNPFHFWKGRLRDHEAAAATSPKQARRGHQSGAERDPPQLHSLQGANIQQQASFSRELKAKQESLQMDTSKRRPPPPRPPTPPKIASPSKTVTQGTFPTSSSSSLSPYKTERDVAGIQERISKFQTTPENSDANSYKPTLRKSPMRVVPVAPVHKGLKKCTSNPVVPTGNGVTPRRGLMTSSSSVDSESAKSNMKNIPSIQTTRASGADLLSSVDDLELYRPRKVRPQPGLPDTRSEGRVLGVAKKIEDSVFLNPRVHRSRERRGSSGDVNQISLDADTMKTTRSSPGTSRRQSSSNDSTSSSNNKHRSWRSQSTSKVHSRSSSHTSVKIKSSGFTSYLDGPEVPVTDTLPPSPPPPSPLHEVSHFLKINNVPEGNHLRPCPSATQETIEFWEMVQRLKAQYSPANSISLLSPVISQQLQQVQTQPTNLKKSPNHASRRHDSVLIVRDQSKEMVVVRVREGGMEKAPAEFVFNVKTTVQTVLSRSLQQLYKGSSTTRDPQQCSLKVCGRDETLGHGRLLSDFEYVHQCLKFAVAVQLVVVERKKPSPIRERRSPLPDLTDLNIASSGLNRCVSIKEANALLDSYHAKEDKFRSFLKAKESPSYPFSLVTTMVQSVVSCVKLLCERLAFIEPPDITDAIFNLRRACKSATQPELETSSLFTPEESVNMPSSERDNWVSVPEREFNISEDNMEDIACALDVLRQAVHHLMSLYCTSFHPGYAPEWDHTPRERASISSFSEQLLRIKILALHRPIEAELRKYDMLQLECCVYQGGRSLSKKAYSPHAKLVRNFFQTVVWNKWLNMSLPLSSLCRESRVLFTLHGLEFPGSGIKWSRTPVAWGILRLFDSRGCLLKGAHLLGMWLGEDADPLESPYCSIHNKKNMVLQVELEDFKQDLCFNIPSIEKSKSKLPGPPPNVSKMLTGIAQKDRFYLLTTSDQKIIWANRLACVSLLGSYPRGLPMVLLSAQSNSGDLTEMWKMMDLWKCSDPIFGLELLDAQFADMKVREKAVEWLSNLANDDVCDFLPQLVQSLRYDSYLSSPMSEFLLKRSTQSHRIAHAVFWYLQLGMVTDVKFRDRYLPILEALKKLCGEQLQQEFANQVELVEQLCAAATTVKSSRDSHRQTALVQELTRVSEKFVGLFRLPLNPSLLVRGIDIESCSFFNSNTVPLKLSFLNADPFGDNVSIIFKVGDDLRQDIVILQMIRLMEKIWLRAGLDLKMVTYQCVATGADQGMLEMVTEAATLRAIQTEHGVTGSFKDKPLSDWLQRHNPTDHAYKQAVENFTLSCAGYCVATYILGICDRHNDNIMVKKSGHMFHIDFGKILGNAQMFGNIKRDRAPFVLTRDMAYVINDGDKPTVRFQKFCDLCCTAYNELRKHTTLFISLLSLILSSGLPEISSLEDVQYVRDALLPGKTEAEATYAFTKHIEDSLSSMATTINFFIHNLAQFKFSSASNAPYLLSFSPQAYSIATDGKIESTIITTYHKWFYPETYYVYQIEVQRGAPEKEKIFRRYREFDELHRKLEQCFPDIALPQLPGKIFIPGKSHTKQTTERRMIELNMYMASVLSLPTQVSESDIIYTFLHCLIRDEQDMARLSEDEVRSSEYGAGKVKLEMHYLKKQEKLTIMVRHVKDLLPREGLDTADPYVKLYLLPDPNKSTKQKTKISKKTLNPTYNETFCYTVSPSALTNRALQLSIWDASNLVGNHCICMTTIEFSKLLTQLNSGSNFVEWFDLYILPDL